MNYKELFSKTPPTKLFFTAAIPGSIGMLASALYQTIDGMLVGRILSGNAFAALNLAMPLVIINFSLADLSASAPPFRFPSVSAKRRKGRPTTFLPVPAS